MSTDAAEMANETEMVDEHAENLAETAGGKRTPDEEIRKLSAENKKRLAQLNEQRQKNADLEKRLKAIEDAKLAEDKKWEDIAKKREQERDEAVKAAEEKISAAQRRAALAEAKRIARDKGMRAEAVKDIDRFLGEFSYDDDGEVIGLEDAIEDMKSSRSYLFQASKVKEDAEDEKPKAEKKPVVTPGRKDGGDTQKDWGKADKNDYASYLQQFGIRA